MSNEHGELLKQAEAGNILIGIDRTFARSFYMNISLDEIKAITGESPYFEKMVIWFFMLVSIIFLLASVVKAFLMSTLFGVLSLIIFPLIYFGYFLDSIRGNARVIGIIIALITAITLYMVGLFKESLGYIPILLIISLLCGRLVYWSSAKLLRLFILRNEIAFEWLREYIVIKDT